MRPKLIILFILLLGTVDAAVAKKQTYCSHYGNKGSANKTTIATPEEDYYDVKTLKLDLNLSNTSTAVGGMAKTEAVVQIPVMSVYAFELDSLITIDSFKLDGNILPVQTTGKVRMANLSGSLTQGTRFIAEVYYHGQAQAGNGQFFTGGLNHVQLGSGTHIMYSLSDPDFTDDWWPCKQSLLDKIDTTTIWVTVDDSLNVGSNGLLQNKVNLSGNKVRYEWQTNYPIDYYLITVAVAPYKEYNYYMHYTDGSNDSMLIQNLIYDSVSYLNATRKAALDSTGYLIDLLSKKYGKYPFYKEKYGHCIAEPLGGGMEHQTMTTLAFAQTTLIAHEMGHQWWGNNVTYGSWKDIWLSEGLATYTEQIFVEEAWGIQAAQAYRTNEFNNAKSVLRGSVYVDDTTSVYRIFDGKLTYSKGAAVAHMLRYIAPQDSFFFKGLQSFQQLYAYGNAYTSDFQNVMEQAYNIKLDTFFNQWIYGEGYPTYRARWYQDGSKVYVQINQTTSWPASVPVFWMPIELRLQSASGDTIVRVSNNQSIQAYTFSWGRSMTGITVDPNDNILNNTLLPIKDPTLSIKNVIFNQIKIYPNPATDSWHVSELPEHSFVKLMDINGKVLWSKAASGNVTIPADSLAKGIYMVEVTIDKEGFTYKVIK